MATITAVEPEAARMQAEDEPLYKVVNGVAVLPSEMTDDSEAVLEDSRYEMVRGVVVELEPMANRAATVAFELGRQLGNHSKSQRLGRVSTETLFLLDPKADSRRRPDVSFVSYERWPRGTPLPDAAWPIAPDLAVEVVSPTDRAEAALDKVREYFGAGVRAVWVVYPELRVAHVFNSFTSIRVVAGEDTLEGGAVVPGFRLPLATLFEDLDG